MVIVSVVSWALLLCGCAAPATKSESALVGDNVLVPVNLLLNTGQIVDSRGAEQLRYLQQRVATSGLFANVYFGASPWPFTLRMDATVDCSPGAGEVAAAIAASATLFLVPHTETCLYKIKASFFNGSAMVAERQYAAPFTKTIQLFGMTQVEGNKKGLDAVYAKMVEDCLQDPPIPRAKSAKGSIDI